MAVLLSRATGNLTTSSTWALVDSTSYLNSESGSNGSPITAGTTARSSTFTPGAIIIDAIAIKLSSRSAAATLAGTLTVELYNSTDTTVVSGTTVTINATDIPLQVSNGDIGWQLFKFASPVTLVAGKAYAVQVYTPNGLNAIVIWTNGTANNWARALRTTTNQAPVAGDDMIVIGEWTGTSNGSTFTCNTTSGSPTLSNVSSFTGLAVGQVLSGTGIGSGAAITALNPGGSTITVSVNSASNQTGTTVTPSSSTGNDLTVTNNQTAATDYGSNTNSTVTPAMSVCKRGTLKWADGSAGNPYLRLSGYLIVYSGGTLNIGTTGTPIPRDSTAILEFDPAADGDMGLVGRNGSTVNIQGLSRTSGKNVWKTLLNADASASGGAPSTSTLTVADDTGWLSGDMVAIASTSRTASDCEAGNLNANAGASSIVVKDATAGAAGQALPLNSNRGLLVAHSGTSPTQAEIILLTRNVVVRSTSATLMAYCFFDTTATVDIDWAEFYYLGENATNKRGVEVATTTGSFSMQFSSVHDTEDGAIYVTGGSANNITCSSNALWNCCTTVANAPLFIASATSGTSITFDSNIVIRTIVSNTVGINMADIGGTVTNNTVAGAASSGISFGEAFGTFGTFSGNVVHSCGFTGISSGANSVAGTISGGASWRNSGVGLSLSLQADLITDGLVLFGNTTTNISIGSSGDITLKNITSSGDTTFATTNGIAFGNPTSGGRLIVDNCDFGTASGIKAAHTQDFNLSSGQMSMQVICRNTKMASATEVATPSNLRGGGFVSSQKHDQTAGNHVFWLQGGKGQTDTTFYNTASPSIRLTPTSATVKMESAPKDRGMQVAVASGATATVSVYIRKSAAGDGTAYSGNQPRLIQRANPALGQDSDVVLATYSSGTGSWAQISGTTSTATDDGAWEIVIDCDGTTGWINIDDLAAA